MRKDKFKILIIVAFLLQFYSCSRNDRNEIPKPGGIVAVELPDKPGMTVKGIVRDQNGKGIKGIVVTDGFNFVVSDEYGRYYLPTDLDKSRFVYLSVPAEYAIPYNKENQVTFYQKLTSGVVNEKYFSLDKLGAPADNHTMIMVGDTQVRSDDNSIPNFENKIIPDIAAHQRTLSSPCYLMNLGDLVNNEVDFYPQYRAIIGDAGVPIFNVIGNHDHDKSKKGDVETTYIFQDNFGPLNYSFSIGKIHYIVLDDVIYTGNAGTPYERGLTDEVLEWLRKDLSYLEKGAKIILNCHIAPLDSNLGSNNSTNFRNFEGMMALLEKYDVQVFAGHRHATDNYIYDRPAKMEMHQVARTGGHLHINCDFCHDGTPSGYLVVEVKGEDISWYYKAVGNRTPQTYQMTVFPPGIGSSNQVLANVWNYDTAWGNVEWWENGQKVSNMMRTSDYFDPNYDAEYRTCTGVAQTSPFYVWHMFSVTPSPGMRMGTVKAFDRFGNKYEKSVNW